MDNNHRKRNLITSDSARKLKKMSNRKLECDYCYHGERSEKHPFGMWCYMSEKYIVDGDKQRQISVGYCGSFKQRDDKPGTC